MNEASGLGEDYQLPCRIYINKNIRKGTVGCRPLLFLLFMFLPKLLGYSNSKTTHSSSSLGILGLEDSNRVINSERNYASWQC